MWIAENWKDYEVIDTSAGEKLERWGNVILRRPDPQAMWYTDDYSKLIRQFSGIRSISSNNDFLVTLSLPFLFAIL